MRAAQLAVASGNCSGWSTSATLGSGAVSTVTGALVAASAVWLLAQPLQTSRLDATTASAADRHV